MIQTLTYGSTIVALAPVIRAHGESRRKAEHAAVGQLLDALAPGETLSHTADGAPVLVGSPLHISISHSATVAAVAVDPVRVIGIDIEDMARAAQIERVLGRVLSSEEMRVYSGHPLEAWTLKEALYKIAGNPGIDWRDGLPIPPRGGAELVHSGPVGRSHLSLVARRDG